MAIECLMFSEHKQRVAYLQTSVAKKHLCFT